MQPLNLRCRRCRLSDISAVEKLLEGQRARLQSVWARDRVDAELLLSSALSLLVEDGQGAVAVAVFHTLPSVAHRADDSEQAREETLRLCPPATWPQWLPALLPGCSPNDTLFLSFWASAALGNERQQRELRQAVVSQALTCLSSLQRILLLQSSSYGSQSALAATALDAAFTPAPLPVAGSPQSSSPSAPVSSVLQCLQCHRSSFFPSISVRLAALEDHDDLLPLVKTQSRLSPDSVDGFLLARIVEPHSGGSSSRRQQPADSLLAALTGAGSVALVAEAGGRAVGLLCLTAAVDMAELRRVADLREYETSSAADREAAQEALQARLRLCFSALLQTAGSCSLPTPPPRTATTAATQQQPTAGGAAAAASVGGADRRAAAELLTAAVECLPPSAAAAASRALSRLPVSQPDSAQPMRESEWLQACDELMREMEREAERWDWADAVEARLPQPGLLWLRQQPQPARRPSATLPAAFCVSLFVLDAAFASQASAFFLPAFALFPQHSLLLLSLPHHSAPFPLLRCMTRLPSLHPAAPHCVFLMHRLTAASLLQPPSVSVAEERDRPTIRRLLTASCSRGSVREADAAAESAAAMPTAGLLLVWLAGECVGLLQLEPLLDSAQLHRLRCHYSLAAVLPGSASASCFSRHRLLRRFLLNPLFQCHLPLVLQESLRLSGADVLQLQLESADAPLNQPALLRILRLMPPTVPPETPTPQPLSAALLLPERSGQGDEAASGLGASSPSSTAAVAAVHPPGPLLAGYSSSPAAATVPAPCPACAGRSCPSFALYCVSCPLLLQPRTEVNARVLIVGCSDAALGCLQRLLTDSGLLFTNLALLTPHDERSGGSEDEARRGGAGAAFLPSSLSLSAAHRSRLCLQSRLRWLRGRLSDVQADARIAHVAVEGGVQGEQQPQLQLAYDELVLCTGLQPSLHRLPVCVPSSASTAPAAAGEPLGVFCLSCDEDGARLASWLRSALSRLPAARVVVHGASLAALTAICGVLASGVRGDCIAWVHSRSTAAADLSAAVFGEAEAAEAAGDAGGWSLRELMAAVLSRLASERLQLLPQTAIVQLNASTAEEGGRLRLSSVTLSSGEVLPADCLLQCDAAEVDASVFALVRRLGLVFDGRLVVDAGFSCGSGGIRAGGPMAKFQRSLQTPETSGLSLCHAAYDSVTVGQRLAAAIVSDWRRRCGLSRAAQQQRQHSPQRLLSFLSSAPRCVLALLPGPLLLFLCWRHSARTADERSEESLTRLSQSFPAASLLLPQPSSAVPGSPLSSPSPSLPAAGFSVSLQYSRSSLLISRLGYWGCCQLPALPSLLRLVGLPVSFCPRLLQRWERREVRNLLLFLLQDWSAPLFAPSFPAFRQQTRDRLHREQAQHMQPLLDKLRHWQQQGGAGAGGGDAAGLQSLASFLPLQFRETVQAALIGFLQSEPQALTLPLSLQLVPDY